MRRREPRRTLAIRVASLLVLWIGCLSPCAVAAPPVKVADAPYPAAFRARVRKAIELGVRHLRTGQLREHAASLPEDVRRRLQDVDFEEAAAVTWVLRRAGVPASDPAFATAARTYRAGTPDSIEAASLLVLALCAEPLANGDPFTPPDLTARRATPDTLSPDDRLRLERTVRYLLDRQDLRRVTDGTGNSELRMGGWGDRHEGANVRDTQIALLALEAAARRGVTVPSKVWLGALTVLLEWQAAKGPEVALKMNEVRGADRWEWTEPAAQRGFGWSGKLSDAASGYETAAGAIGLIVCQDALQADATFTNDLRDRTRNGVRDALAWVQANYRITGNPTPGRKDVGEALYHHHWLQGLARLAIHSRIRFVGTHDWYREGADLLLKTQREDGAWGAIWWRNCYALLFLLRASHTSIVPVVTTVSEPNQGK